MTKSQTRKAKKFLMVQPSKAVLEGCLEDSQYLMQTIMKAAGIDHQQV